MTQFMFITGLPRDRGTNKNALNSELSIVSIVAVGHGVRFSQAI